MNTYKHILLMLAIPIAVVVACQPVAGAPCVKCGPEAVSLRHSKDFLGTWTIEATKECPDRTKYDKDHDYNSIPGKGDKFEIFFNSKTNKFGIRAVTDSGMDEWDKLVLTYKPGEIQERPKGPEVTTISATTKERELSCDFGPSYKADRLYGCIPSEGIASCFDIDLVKESTLHVTKWAPIIYYSDAYLHNGIIH